MIKIGLIGAGKMGLSHLAILGAHPDVQITGVCDTSSVVLSALKKFSDFPCYSSIEKFIAEADTDAVVVATPTKFHYDVILDLLKKKKHVFSEKPLTLSPGQSAELDKIARENNLVNQVGYHNKFIATFQELKRLMRSGYLGSLLHFTAESYGPVVVKAKQSTWRSKTEEGGGCLYDYASHVIDLVNDIIGPVESVSGALTKSLYSNEVEDGVYAFLHCKNQTSGVLSVNWSDETYRKMSTTLTLQGTNGKIICDANEMKLFFKGDPIPAGYEVGWNTRNISQFEQPINFYLRGEEYSMQLDYFVQSIIKGSAGDTNSFATASHTDKVISLIREKSSSTWKG